MTTLPMPRSAQLLAAEIAFVLLSGGCYSTPEGGTPPQPGDPIRQCHVIVEPGSAIQPFLWVEVEGAETGTKRPVVRFLSHHANRVVKDESTTPSDYTLQTATLYKAVLVPEVFQALLGIAEIGPDAGGPTSKIRVKRVPHPHEARHWPSHVWDAGFANLWIPGDDEYYVLRIPK